MVYGEAPSHLPSNLEASDAKALQKRIYSALNARESKKANHYKESCARERWSFEPFVVESHGFVGKGATKVLDEVAKYASDNYSVQRAELAGYLRRRVAIAL